MVKVAREKPAFLAQNGRFLDQKNAGSKKSLRQSYKSEGNPADRIPLHILHWSEDQLMVNVAGLDALILGAGLTTVMVAAPTVVMALAGTVACNCMSLT